MGYAASMDRVLWPFRRSVDENSPREIEEMGCAVSMKPKNPAFEEGYHAL